MDRGCEGRAYVGRAYVGCACVGCAHVACGRADRACAGCDRVGCVSADRACAGCEYAESDREGSENVALAPAALANANEDRARGVSARGVSARAMVGAGAGWSELPMALEALLRTSDYIPGHDSATSDTSAPGHWHVARGSHRLADHPQLRSVAALKYSRSAIPDIDKQLMRLWNIRCTQAHLSRSRRQRSWTGTAPSSRGFLSRLPRSTAGKRPCNFLRYVETPATCQVR